MAGQADKLHVAEVLRIQILEERIEDVSAVVLKVTLLPEGPEGDHADVLGDHHDGPLAVSLEREARILNELAQQRVG